MSPSQSLPAYPDDVAGAMAMLSLSPGTRFYDTFAPDYPSAIPAPAVNGTVKGPVHGEVSALEHEQEIAEHLHRSQRIRHEISHGKHSLEKPTAGNNDSTTPQTTLTPLAPVSRCGVWDLLGASHSWRAGSIRMPTRSVVNEGSLGRTLTISTVWERQSVSVDSKGVLAAGLPEPSTWFARDSTIFQSTNSKLAHGKPGADYDLVSTVDGSKLTDVLTIPSHLAPGCPDAAVKIFELARGLDARSALAVLLSSDFVNVTAALYRGRSAFYAGGHGGEAVPAFPDKLFTFAKPSLYRPVQVQPLLPKLSGVARDTTCTFDKALEHVGARGCLSLPTPFSFTIGYDVGLYGHVLGPVCAKLDCSFLYDYSVGSQNEILRNILEEQFPSVCSNFSGGTCIERCVATVAPIVWANYEALHYKTRLEDSIKSASQPCLVVWEDLSLLSTYRLVDGGFNHIWFDSDMSIEATAVSGLGIAAHDLFDLAADLSCGEVGNVVPTLTRGDLSLPSLVALYSRMGAIIRWYGTQMPHDTAAMSMMLTIWWQMGNMRHRVAQAVCVPALEERVCTPRMETIDHRPRFEDYVVGDHHDEEIAWLSSQDRPAVPDFNDEALPAELRALGRDFILPLSLAAMSATPQPPPDHVGASRIMAVMSRGLNAETRPLMWKWVSYLWDSGTLWCSVLGMLCYRHDGYLNDDRARTTHTSAVWLG